MDLLVTTECSHFLHLVHGARRRCDRLDWYLYTIDVRFWFHGRWLVVPPRICNRIVDRVRLMAIAVWGHA